MIIVWCVLLSLVKLLIRCLVVLKVFGVLSMKLCRKMLRLFRFFVDCVLCSRCSVILLLMLSRLWKCLV